MSNLISFVPGSFYAHTYAGDSELKVTYKITRRTAKSVWIARVNPGSGRISTDVQCKRIYVYRGVESVSMGSYSMAPVLSADKEVPGLAKEINQTQQGETVTPRNRFYGDIDTAKAKIKVCFRSSSAFIPGEGTFTFGALGLQKIGEETPGRYAIRKFFHDFVSTCGEGYGLTFL